MMAENINRLRNKLWRSNHLDDRWKKRLLRLGLINADEKFYCYKHQTKPCSCIFCIGKKFNRAKEKQNYLNNKS